MTSSEIIDDLIANNGQLQLSNRDSDQYINQQNGISSASSNIVSSNSDNDKHLPSKVIENIESEKDPQLENIPKDKEHKSSNVQIIFDRQETVIYKEPETVNNASKKLVTKEETEEEKIIITEEQLINISLTLETEINDKLLEHGSIELNSISYEVSNTQIFDNQQQTVIELQPETVYQASNEISIQQKSNIDEKNNISENEIKNDHKQNETLSQPLSHTADITPLSGQIQYNSLSHALSPSEVDAHMQMIEPQNNTKQNTRVLSRVPYNLSKLRSKNVMLNLLRETKFRELLHVSYLARYIFCSICGAISFIFAAFLWKYVFEIDICCIEGDNLRLHAMPFFFAICSYINGPLLAVCPVFYIILPTAGVRHRHRRHFIIFFLCVTLVLYLAYGFYARSWDMWKAIVAGAMLIGVVIICLYWGGYYAIWVAFPMLSAAGVAFGIIQAMDRYVWHILREKKTLFGVAYSWYLTCLQSIILYTMIYARLPHKIRQFCYRCCPNCCCSENTGETPRYYEPDENEDGKELKIGHRKKHSHYRFKTEAELTIDDVWGNNTTFFATGAVVVCMESMRVAGMIFVRDDPLALALNVVSTIVSECLTRNNVYTEVFYRCCLKKENPALGKFHAILFGVRYQAEYIPYYVVLLMNFMQYGPTDTRDMSRLGSTVYLPWKRYWWMYIVLFGSEIFSDIFAHFAKKYGRKKGWFGNSEDGDPARRAKFVKLKLWVMCCTFISFFSLSLFSFDVDYDAREGDIDCSAISLC